MAAFDGKSFGAEIVSAVRDYVASAIRPLSGRLEAIERSSDEIRTMLSAIPEGKPGADGVGFDDMMVEYDGARTITLKFQRGDVLKEFPFQMPILLDQGVYQAEKTYAAGDVVTWGGSLWIAQKSTATKPDNADWRLAVKRGRDAKQG